MPADKNPYSTDKSALYDKFDSSKDTDEFLSTRRKFVDISTKQEAIQNISYNRDNLINSSLNSLFKSQSENLKEPTDDVSRDKLNMNSNPKVSKNLIFSTSQAVSKPAEFMTEIELDELKGITKVATVPSSENYVSESNLQEPKSTSTINSEIRMLSTLSSRRSWVNLDSNALQVDTKNKEYTDNLTKLLLQQHSLLSPHITSSSFTLLKSPHIRLSFFPTEHNFLGEGRYGQVFRGMYSIDSSVSDLSDKEVSDQPMKECAVKRMSLTPESQIMAFSEVFILKRLSHPNIISLLGVKDEESLRSSSIHSLETNDSGSLFNMRSARLLLVLELASKGNVWNYIVSSKCEIGLKLWLKWALQSTSALAFIHEKGIIHHDIKPHNMLLNEALDIKLGDFGNVSFTPNKSPTLHEFNQENQNVSKHYIDTISSNSFGSHLPSFKPMTPISRKLSLSTSSPNNDVLFEGIGRGTQAYTAPELYTSNGEYSFPADVYSLGVSFYVCATGVNPFTSVKSPVHMINAIKKGFFECGMQVDPYADGPVEGVARFLDGTLIPKACLRLMKSMVARNPGDRPTAQRAHKILSDIRQE